MLSGEEATRPRGLHLCRKQAQREPSWRVGGRLGALSSPKPPAFSGNRCEGPQRMPEPRPHAQAGAPGCLGQEPAGPCPAAPSAGAGSWPSLFCSRPSAFARAAAVPGGALGVSTDPSGAPPPHGSQGLPGQSGRGPRPTPRQPELCFYLSSRLPTLRPKNSFERRVPLVEKI